MKKTNKKKREATVTRMDYPWAIPDTRLVKAIEAGDYVYIQTAFPRRKDENGSPPDDTKRKTGAGKHGTVKKYASRADNLQSMKMACKELEYAILENCKDPEKCLFVTLTYGYDVDYHHLSKHTEKFLEKLHAEVGDFGCICCREPQRKGRWHIHLILVFEEEALFIPQEVVGRMWGRGFVHVERVTSAEGLFRDMTKFWKPLSVFDVVEAGIMSEDEAEKKAKWYSCETLGGCENGICGGGDCACCPAIRCVPYALLYLYPASFHPFSYGKGIRRPKAETLGCKAAKSKYNVQDKRLDYRYGTRVEKGRFRREIIYERYKK